MTVSPPTLLEGRTPQLEPTNTGAQQPKAAWTNKRERRLASDGKLRTRKEFQNLFGGTTEWNVAARHLE